MRSAKNSNKINSFFFKPVRKSKSSKKKSHFGVIETFTNLMIDIII